MREPVRHERVPLDQLLSDWEGAAEPRRRLPSIVRDAALALFLGGGSYAVLRVFGFVAPFVVLSGTFFVALLLRRALYAVPVAPMPSAMYSPAWGVEDGSGGPGRSDGLLRAVMRWESRFDWTERDHVRYGIAVRPRLQELVGERLRQRHGVTVRGDPQRARALIGEPLWQFLYAPVTRTPNPREVAAMVAEMEKL